MTGKILPFTGVTRLDIPSDVVLDKAKKHCSDGVIVLGYNDEGEMYFASSMADAGTVFWALALAQKAILEAGSYE